MRRSVAQTACLVVCALLSGCERKLKGTLQALLEADASPVEKARAERYVAKPIPSGTNAPTLYAFKQTVFFPFMREQLGVPGQSSSPYAGADAKAVAELLESQCAAAIGRDLGDQKEAWAKADKLVQAGCSHPSVRWMQAMHLLASKKPKEAAEALRKLDAELAESPDRAFQQMLIAYGLRRAENSPEAAERLYARIAAWLAEVLKEPKQSRAAKSLIANWVNFKSDDGLVAHLAKIEPLDRWFFLVVRGTVAISQAWEARGSGWARSVTQEGWKGFASNLAQARADLTEAWKLRPELPDAAAEMITVSGADGQDDMRLWFDRTAAAEIDLPGAYMQYLWFSRPRWCGSTEQMRAFAEECYATRRFDTNIPYYYVRGLMNVGEEGFDSWQDLFREEGVYQKSVEVCESILSSDRFDTVTRVTAQNLLTLITWAVGDFDKSIAFNKARGGRYSQAARNMVGGTSYFSITYALDSLTGTNGLMLTELTRQYFNKRYEEVQAGLQKLRSEAKLSGKELDWVVPMEVGCQIGLLFPKREWIDLPMNARHSGWINYGLRYKLQDKGYVIKATAGPLDFIPPVPEDMAFEGRFNFLPDDGKRTVLTVLLDDSGGGRQGVPMITFERKEGQVIVQLRGAFNSSNYSEAVPLGDCLAPVKFQIVSKANQVTLLVDDKALFEQVDLSRAFMPSNRDKTRILNFYAGNCRLSGMRLRGP